MNRLKEKYLNTIKPELVKEFDIKNPMLIPGLEKIIISVGAGKEAGDKKLLKPRRGLRIFCYKIL